VEVDDVADEKEALEDALGLGNSYGFHIEDRPEMLACAETAQVGPGPSLFPCVGAHGSYTGCKGRKCKAPYCWAGSLVRSASRSRLRLPRRQRAGARCSSCALVTADHHLRYLGKELLACAAEHFSGPITPSCLAARRVPDSVTLPCPDYQEASSLHPVVLEWRRRHRASCAKGHRRKRREKARARADKRRRG